MARRSTGKRVTTSDGVRVHGKNGNGAGSVYFDAARNGYRATYIDPTSGKKRTVSASTKTAVVERRDAALAELTKKTPGGALGTNPTIEEFTTWWVDNVASTQVRPATLHTYKKDVARIVDGLGAQKVSNLTPEAVIDWQAEMTRSGLSIGTRRNARTRLSQLAKQAVAAGYLPHNPVQFVPAPKALATERTKKRTLTPDETRKLLATLTGDKALDAAVALLFTTGLRVSSVLGLAWNDIDLDAGTVTIRRGCTYTGGGIGLTLDAPKTSTTAGVHHLSPFGLKMLKARRHRQDADRAAAPGWDTITYEGESLDMVFTTRTGGLVARQDVTNAIHRACEQAGIDPTGVGTHTGRRSVVTSLFTSGVPIDDVARHVGHSDPATTAGYVQDLGTRPADTARRAARLLDPSPPS